MKNFFVRWLVFLLVSPAVCHALQAPPSSMQWAVSGVMQQKMAARGISSSSAAWGSTLQAAGSLIAADAASAAVVTAVVAGTVVTAPGWITVGASLALTALFTAGISLAIDGIKWFFNNDGTVTTAGAAAGPLVAGGAYYLGQYACGYGSSPAGAVSACMGNPSYAVAGYLVSVGACTGSDGTGYACVVTTKTGGQQTVTVQFFASGSPYSSTTGSYSNGLVQPGVTTAPVTQTATQAFAGLSDADKAKPLNPAIVAAIADTAWKNAAAVPGYQGVPYDPAQPIAAADAAQWQAANPGNWPTVGQALSPQGTPAGGSAGDSFSLPNSAAPSAGGTTGVTTGSPAPPVQTATAAGLDWSVANDTEVIPTQAAPVTYTPTIFAAPTGCPAPISFSMFGKPYEFGYQPMCDLMSTVAPIFLALGAAAAALIFAGSLKS